MLSLLKNLSAKFTRVEKILLLLFILLIIGSIGVLNQQAKTGPQVPATGGDFSEGLVGQPQHINPLLSQTNEVDADLARVIYSGLYQFDKDLQLVPDMAEAMPTVSADGKTFTIKIRDKIFWHDGAKLTADDVVFTVGLLQNQEISSPLRTSWTRVGIEKVDELTVKFTTRDSSATFPTNLTVGILPKHIWENISVSSFALSKYNLEPIGTGPYKIKEIKRGRSGEIKSIGLVSFDRFYEGKPYINNIEFKFYSDTNELINSYQTRDITALGYVPFDKSLFIDPNSKLQQIQLSLPQYQAIFINRTKNPAALGDVRVRMALAKSVDKEKIISDVYGGKATQAYGPILPGYLGYHEQIPGADMNIYDPEKAKSLLESTGWNMDPATGFRKDKLGRIITVELATNNYSPNVRVAENLKTMWEEIGVQVILKIEAVADLEENYIRPRNYELLLFSQNIGADPDPYSFWHSSQLHDPGQNLTNFSNKATDKLLVDARTNIPPDQRAAKYRQFQELFVGDVPAIFLAQSQFVYNVGSQVKGFDLKAVVTPSDRFADINYWYIETKRAK